MLWNVFQDAFVVVCPKLFKQRTFRRYILVGIQDQHLGFRFVLLEIMRDLACTLIGSGGATIGCFWNGDGKHPAIRHIHKLFTQIGGLLSSFPSLQNLTRVARLLETFNCIEHQFNTRRKNHLVIANTGAARKSRYFLGSVDIAHVVANHIHAMFAR